MEEKLYLGVGRTIITPKVGAYLYGYRPDVISTSVNDDLNATAFYFKQGNEQALLVSLTVCGMDDKLCSDICEAIEKKHGIPKELCLLHSIHTHSGPTLKVSTGWGNIDVEYCEQILIPRVMEAVDTAVNAAAPVKMAIATGESYIGINRRELTVENEITLGQNPWGPFNPKMTIISFKGEDGALVANLVHYGIHSTAAGMNHEISRDWSGVMIDVMEKELGGVAAFICGPEGDVGPRNTNGLTIGLGDVSYAMRLGAVAAHDAIRIYKNMSGYHTPHLTTVTSSVDIPFGHRIPIDAAKAEIEKYRGFTANIRARLLEYYQKVIDSYSNGYVEPECDTVKQAIIRLGDVAFVSFPYELFCEIGLRIQKYSDIPHVLPLINVNGAEAYFATQSELCRGGYEINMFKTKHLQPYVDNADWYLIKGTLKNLKETEK